MNLEKSDIEYYKSLDLVNSLSKNSLEYLYLNKLLTAKEIAELLEVSIPKVIGALNRFKISKPYTNKEWLNEQYNVQKKTIKQICEELNCDRESVRIYLRKFGFATDTERARKAGKKYNYNERIFQNIDTPEKAYWAGFITADGCIEDLARKRADGSIYHNYRLRFCLAYKDIDHLKKFTKFLNDESLPITDSYVKDNERNTIHHMCHIKVCCKQMALDLIKHGITPRKSLHEQPLKDISPELVSHYIRGILDGDGCILNTNIGIIIVGSYDLMSWINNQFDNKGYIHPDDHSKDLWKFALHKKTLCKEFLNWIYNDSTVYLDRKYLIYTRDYIDLPAA